MPVDSNIHTGLLLDVKFVGEKKIKEIANKKLWWV